MFIVKKKHPAMPRSASRDNDPKNDSKTISSPLEDAKSARPNQAIDDIHAVETLAEEALQDALTRAVDGLATARSTQRPAGDASGVGGESQSPGVLTARDIAALDDLLDRANAYAGSEELQQPQMKQPGGHAQDKPLPAATEPPAEETH